MTSHPFVNMVLTLSGCSFIILRIAASASLPSFTAFLNAFNGAPRRCCPAHLKKWSAAAEDSSAEASPREMEF